MLAVNVTARSFEDRADRGLLDVFWLSEEMQFGSVDLLIRQI